MTVTDETRKQTSARSGKQTHVAKLKNSIKPIYLFNSNDRVPILRPKRREVKRGRTHYSPFAFRK